MWSTALRESGITNGELREVRRESEGRKPGFRDSFRDSGLPRVSSSPALYQGTKTTKGLNWGKFPL